MADVMGDDRLLKMKDEDGVVSPFDGIEKGSVLQDCRCFNDLQLDTQKCEAVLVRLLYLVGQGEKLSSAEATDVFFSVTKLFQANAVRFGLLCSWLASQLGRGQGLLTMALAVWVGTMALVSWCGTTCTACVLALVVLHVQLLTRHVILLFPLFRCCTCSFCFLPESI